MQVLIIGGTNFIGPHVVRYLLTMAHQVSVFHRSNKGITQRLVVISSIDVYRAYGVLRRIESGPVESVPLTEDSPRRRQLYPFQHLSQRPLNRQQFSCLKRFCAISAIPRFVKNCKTL